MLPMLSPAVMVLLTFFIEGARSQLPDQECNFFFIIFNAVVVLCLFS